jgi:hypothetical protein
MLPVDLRGGQTDSGDAMSSFGLSSATSRQMMRGKDSILVKASKTLDTVRCSHSARETVVWYRWRRAGMSGWGVMFSAGLCLHPGELLSRFALWLTLKDS